MRALVMSGGGSYGAYQVGVLRALAAAGQASWDLFCGTSVGAINVAHLAQYRRSIDGVLELEHLWRGLRTEKIHRSWAFGYLSGFWRLGFRDNSPLRKLLRENFSPARVVGSGKKLRILAVSLQSFKTFVWDEYAPDLVEVMMASSAVPGVFSPVKLGGEYWADGGVRDTTPLKEAIVADVTDIDVILTYSMASNVYRAEPKSAIDVAQRAFEIMNDEIAKTDVKLAMAYNELAQQGIQNGVAANKRPVNIRLFQPSEPFEGDPFSFDPELIRDLIVLGDRDTQEVLRG